MAQSDLLCLCFTDQLGAVLRRFRMCAGRIVVALLVGFDDRTGRGIDLILVLKGGIDKLDLIIRYAVVGFRFDLPDNRFVLRYVRVGKRDRNGAFLPDIRNRRCRRDRRRDRFTAWFLLLPERNDLSGYGVDIELILAIILAKFHVIDHLAVFVFQLDRLRQRHFGRLKPDIETSDRKRLFLADIRACACAAGCVNGVGIYGLLCKQHVQLVDGQL